MSTIGRGHWTKEDCDDLLENYLKYYKDAGISDDDAKSMFENYKRTTYSRESKHPCKCYKKTKF